MSIERDFLNDIREKKRLGNNIFHRKATIKGGRNQPLKTPYYFMSKKERERLNGIETTYDLKEIISIEQFNKLNDDLKKEYLKSWKDNYSNDYIAIKLGVNYEKVKEIYEQNNVSSERKRGSRTSIQLNGNVNHSVKHLFKRIEDGKDITFDEFITFDIPTQLRLFILLQKHFTNKKQNILEDYLNTPKLIYYQNLKARSAYNSAERDVKKFLERSINLSENSNEVTQEKLDRTSSHKDDVEAVLEDAKEEKNQENQTLSDIDIELSNFSMKINGYVDNKTLSRRLKSIKDEIKSGKNTVYKVSIKIEEV